MNKIWCLLALSAVLIGYSLAEESEEAADLYLAGEDKGYDEYEGSAEYDDEGSAVDPYPYDNIDQEEDDGEEEGSGGPWSVPKVTLSDCERLLQKVQRKNMVGAYEPRCTSTGDFEAMQCSSSTGECWCVNNYGQTVPGTVAKTPWEPDCTNVDRYKDYPKKPIIPTEGGNGVGAEPPKSGEDEITEDNGGKMTPNTDPEVEIGKADPEGDTGEEGDSSENTQEKIPNNGLLGKPLILAGLIAIAVVCLLCAVLLVMFIVYRMRKKDEGSYALDEPKRSPSHPYQRAPTREYFA